MIDHLAHAAETVAAGDVAYFAGLVIAALAALIVDQRLTIRELRRERAARHRMTPPRPAPANTCRMCDGHGETLSGFVCTCAIGEASDVRH